MISGRYRSEDLTKHWTPSNRQGYCQAKTCVEVAGSLEHILVECPALQQARNRQIKLWHDRSSKYPALHQMLGMVLASPAQVQVQFILDPSMFNGIIMLWEVHGQVILDHVYYLTRTYAYYLHREKLILHGRWPGDFGRRQTPKDKKPLKFHSDYISSVSGSGDLPPDLCNEAPPNHVVHESQHMQTRYLPYPSYLAATDTPAQPRPHTAIHLTRTNQRSAPAYSNPVWSDLCAAGYICDPLGGRHAAVSHVRGGGRSGGDEEE